MKKKVAIILAVLIMALGLVACGGSASPYVGSWDCTTAETGGYEFETSMLYDEFYMEIEANGDCVLVIDGEEYPGTWVEAEGGFIVDDELDFYVSGDEAVTTLDGVTFTFVKQ